MKLFVWLWNPWEKYENTRHNIWFKILEYLAEENWFVQFLNQKKFNCKISNWRIWKWPTSMIKPLTFMNLSGDAVQKIMNYYDIDKSDILIIHDDIDLPVWKIKLKFGWKSWWHNWIKDIVKKIWTERFWRLKIWVGRPETKEEVTDYVLWKIWKTELNMIFDNKKEIIDKVDEYLRNTW